MSEKKETKSDYRIEPVQKDGVHSVYLQVAQCLRSQLALGRLTGPDGKLPTYRKLADDFGVSIRVIQNAMRVLRNESLVQTCHGLAGRPVHSTGREVKPAMIRLALIHPFRTGLNVYASYLQKCMDRLGYTAMITVQESCNDPDLELKIAENLIYNNFDAILLSPEDTFSNEQFFFELSSKIPVMLLDQPFPHVNLPATIVDYAGGGLDIGRELCHRKCHHVLAILDENGNSSMNDIVEGIAKYLPVHRFEFALFKSEALRQKYDYKNWDIVVKRLKQTLIEHPEIDAVFSPFDTILDQLYISEIPKEMREKRYMVSVRDENFMMHSRDYLNCNLLEWKYDRCNEQIFIALKRLMKWRQTRMRPIGIKKNKMKLDHKCDEIF